MQKFLALARDPHLRHRLLRAARPGAAKRRPLAPFPLSQRCGVLFDSPLRSLDLAEIARRRTGGCIPARPGLPAARSGLTRASASRAKPPGQKDESARGRAFGPPPAPVGAAGGAKAKCHGHHRLGLPFVRTDRWAGCCRLRSKRSTAGRHHRSRRLRIGGGRTSGNFDQHLLRY